MIAHQYKLKQLGEVYGVDLKLPDDIVVVNTETGNDIMVNGTYKPETGFVTVVGYLYDDNVYLFCRTEQEDVDFYNAVDKVMDKIKGLKLFAFNKVTEEGNLFAMFGKNYSINEINTTTKRYKRDSFYQLIYDRQILKTPSKIYDPITNPMECITIWQEYTKAKDHSKLTKLIEHGLAILIKEALILKHIEQIKKVLG